jgi:hypothetical protein
MFDTKINLKSESFYHSILKAWQHQKLTSVHCRIPNFINENNLIVSIFQILTPRKLISKNKHPEMMSYYKFVQSSQE